MKITKNEEKETGIEEDCSTEWDREHSLLGVRIAVQLVSSLTRLALTKEENKLLFICSEAVESNLVRLVTSRTVMIHSTVSVL